MSRLAQGVAVAVIMALPVGAWGHGLGLLHPRTTVAYYYPAVVEYVPVVAYPVYPVCVPPPLPSYPSVPVPSGLGQTYAPPTAAPPSAGPSTPEPPLAAPLAPAKPSAATPGRSPGFGESTSFYNAYSVAGQYRSRPVGERCMVDFWNLTGRDLVLRIEGEPPQVLPRGKSVPVAIGRQFRWQVEGRETQTTRIDDGESALQIVIRR
jgi:hypothetical protein